MRPADVRLRANGLIEIVTCIFVCDVMYTPPFVNYFSESKSQISTPPLPLGLGAPLPLGARGVAKV